MALTWIAARLILKEHKSAHFFQLLPICWNTHMVPSSPLIYLVAAVFPCDFTRKHLKKFKTSISNEGRYLNKIRIMLEMKKKEWMSGWWPVMYTKPMVIPSTGKSDHLPRLLTAWLSKAAKKIKWVLSVFLGENWVIMSELRSMTHSGNGSNN